MQEEKLRLSYKTILKNAFLLLITCKEVTFNNKNKKNPIPAILISLMVVTF